MAKSQIPKTRRLTRAEAKRLGVSWSAKRRVDAKLKTVTKRTKLYTDRQVAEAKHGKRREIVAGEKKEIRTLKAGGTATEFKNLTKPNLIKVLKKYRQKIVILKFHGAEGSRRSEYKGKDISTSDDEQWFTAHERINAEELLDPDIFNDYLEDSDVSGSLKYSVIVYS